MNRRLFAGQLVAGISLLSVPGSLLAQPFATRVTALVSVQKAADWIQSGSLGSLQHVALSHVYSPERTSLATLMVLLEQELASVSDVLGLPEPLTPQALGALSASGFGSYAARLERDGLSVSWQGLARIGSETADPVTRLSLVGNKGIIQKDPLGQGYSLIDLQTQRSQSENSLNGLPVQLNRRGFFSL